MTTTHLAITAVLITAAILIGPTLHRLATRRDTAAKHRRPVTAADILRSPRQQNRHARRLARALARDTALDHDGRDEDTP